MTLSKFLIPLGTLLLSGGIFLLTYPMLITVSEWTNRLWQRIFRTWASKRLHEMGILQDRPFQAPSIEWKRVALFFSIMIMAVSVRDILLSPLVILFGLGILIWLQFESRQIEEYQVNVDAEGVALQMRALIDLDHSLVNALMKVELPDGRLKLALNQVVARLRMHQSPEQAVQSIQLLPGAITGRLSALIAFSSSLTDSVQDDLLLSLEQEAHRQKLLRSKSHQTLALVRGTIRLLQAVVAAAILFVMLTPDWRFFFLQDFSHRVLLTTLMIASAIASLYFEFEVYQLSYGGRG